MMILMKPGEKPIQMTHNPRLQADTGLHGLASFDPHRLHCFVQPSARLCAAEPQSYLLEIVIWPSYVTHP